MKTEWEAVVVDSRELKWLREGNTSLRASNQRQKVALCFFAGLSVVAMSALWWQAARLQAVSHQARESRKSALRSSSALKVLARSHEHMLSATELAPSVGTKSWGRRFTVTKYLPRSPAYGKDNDGLTATLIKADPKERIVAVDPKLIPYGSWVWIEEQGWYRAEDCGGAIKGFRLDLLTATEEDALAFGKQDRFVIVVPPDNRVAARGERGRPKSESGVS
jgi:3D (Asp-Asp-Asp) domain-containing protein